MNRLIAGWMGAWVGAICVMGAGVPGLGAPTEVAATTPAAVQGEQPAASERDRDTVKIPITLTGGHDTDPRDHGRPVILIAAALKVPADVFRETFTHVKPAGPGQEPDPEQVRKNKAALMHGLGPYGVTDERLNEVSNFYRYNRRKQDLWRHTSAEGYATVRKGVITAVTLTNPGAGYSSGPIIQVPGFNDARFKVTLSFGPDLPTNGAIKEIAVVPPAGK